MTTFNSAPEDEGETGSFSIIQVAPSLPFKVSFRLPFSRNRVTLGRDSLERLRKLTLLHPEDMDAHITFAAHLLSEQPVLPAQAGEAIKHLTTALILMPPDEETESERQHKAMVHLFLGDAWIIFEQRQEACRHWKQAIVLDPVSPPHGFSGEAQRRLDKYPAEE